MRKMIKRRNIIWLTLLVSLFTRSLVFSLNVAVSPAVLEFLAEPGEFFTGELEITGAKEKTVRMRAYLEDWQFDRGGAVNFFAAGTLPRSAAGWLRIEPADFIVPAGEKRLIRVFGTVPPETEAGDYWAAFFVESIPLLPAKKSGVTVTGRLGGSITVTVEGETEKKAQVTYMDVCWEEGISGKIHFVNEGNVRLNPHGRVEIRDIQGKSVETILIPEARVLPGQEREIRFGRKIVLEKGSYVALAILDYGGEKLVGAQAVFEVGS